MFTRLILLPFVIASAVLMGLWWGHHEIGAPGPSRTVTRVIIPAGQGLDGIKQALTSAGIIRHPWLFDLAARISDQARQLKAGEFDFPAGASIADVLVILRLGRSVVYKLTIPEGLSSAEIADRLRAEPALSGDIMDIPMNGALLPETYYFSRGDQRADILQRMRDAMAKTADRLWRSRANDLPVLSLHDAVTLASIVEKETAVAAEREVIAGVFMNRLRKGMRLQSDPTVVFALTGGPPLPRALTRRDLKQPHPYNTYLIKGLPPGAITNPGAAALAAVMQPAKTPYYYFVANGKGGHAFAETLAKHNRNVAAWRRLNRK